MIKYNLNKTANPADGKGNKVATSTEGIEIGNEAQAQVTLSAEELNLLASMPKTSARFAEDMQTSEELLADEVEANTKLTLVELEEVLFWWPTLTEGEIKFVEIVSPYLKEVAEGRKDLQLSTSRISQLFHFLGYNGFGQRTIQRRLRSLWEKGVVSNRRLKSFNLQRYVELYYYSKVFVPLKHVFEPLAPVEDEEAAREAWHKMTAKALKELNGYLAPWGVRVVDKKHEVDG